MANTAQARKRVRQSEKRNIHLSARRSEARTAIKAAQKAISSGDTTLATAVFRSTVSLLDRVANKKIIHKNKAARHKRQLAKSLKALALSSTTQVAQVAQAS